MSHISVIAARGGKCCVYYTRADDTGKQGEAADNTLIQGEAADNTLIQGEAADNTLIQGEAADVHKFIVCKS